MACVNSIITYPIVPLAQLRKSNITNLQKIQNRGTRFITDFKLNDRKSSMYLHELSRLSPLNIRMFERSEKVLDKVKEMVEEEVANKMNVFESRRWRSYREKNLRWFPSLQIHIEKGRPVPIYK